MSFLSFVSFSFLSHMNFFLHSRKVGNADEIAIPSLTIRIRMQNKRQFFDISKEHNSKGNFLFLQFSEYFCPFFYNNLRASPVGVVLWIY